MQFWLLVTYLNLFSTINYNYFFDSYRVNGMTKQQWLTKCKNILHETQLQQVIFNIKDLCTQLRCLEDNTEVYIGFDFCMRSSVRCMYPEPDTTLPFPECCLRQQCYGTNGLISFKKFMERKEGKYAARVQKGEKHSQQLDEAAELEGVWRVRAVDGWSDSHTAPCPGYYMADPGLPPCSVRLNNVHYYI